MSHATRNRNRKVNRKLEAAFRRMGLNCGVCATTREGKRLGLVDDNDFPPEIDDHVQYGSRPVIGIVEMGPDGVIVSGPPQAVTKTPDGPEAITHDCERPEILEFAVRRMQTIRERLSSCGAENVELKEVILTQHLPPVFVTVFGGDDECRRLTEEQINAILSDPNKDETYKGLIRGSLEALPYYEWVGGSPFSDECWQLVRYAGIRLLISAFLPNDAVERLLAESQPIGV